MADLPTEATQLAIAVAEQCRALRTLINGNALDLSSLDTTAKGSLVDAINEIFAMGGGGTELTNYSQISSLTGYPVSFPPTIGSGAAEAVAGNDARLTDARTPTAHKSSHATGGSDALAPSDIGAIPATGGTMTNGTIGGTLTINSTSITFGTGAAAAFWAALGGDGTQTIGGAKSYSGQVELLNQSATNATSAMTRSLTQTEIAKSKAFEIPAGNSYTFKITGQSSGVNFNAAGSGIDVSARSFTTAGSMSLVGASINGCNDMLMNAVTVSGLGTATAYRERWVSDANAPAIGAIVSGGGTTKAKVAGNGAKWIVIAII